MQLLLGTGQVDVNARDRGDLTPMLWALQKDHKRVVKLLPDTGKVGMDDMELVESLLNTGLVDADVASRAKRKGHKAAVDLLQKWNRS